MYTRRFQRENICLVVKRPKTNDLVVGALRYKDGFLALDKDERQKQQALAFHAWEEIKERRDPTAEQAEAKELIVPNVRLYSFQESSLSTFLLDEPMDRLESGDLVFHSQILPKILQRLAEFRRAEILFEDFDWLSFAEHHEPEISDNPQSRKIAWKLTPILGFDSDGVLWACGWHYGRRLYKLNPDPVVVLSQSNFSSFANIDDKHILVGTSKVFGDHSDPGFDAAGLWIINKSGTSLNYPMEVDIYRIISVGSGFILHTNVGLFELNFLGGVISPKTISLDKIPLPKILEDIKHANFRVSYDETTQLLWVSNNKLVGFFDGKHWYIKEVNDNPFKVLAAFGKCYLIKPHRAQGQATYQSVVFEADSQVLVSAIKSGSFSLPITESK